MAAAVKAAAFTAFLRVWLEAFPAVADSWHGPVWWLAAATMVVGNLVALAQKNIKRMLAYSSIAHAGYILVAVAIGTPAATSAFMFYLLAYTLATFGAFGVIVAQGEAGENLNIEDYSGLWHVQPRLAVAMAIFMLALLGFPIFGGIGFLAKYWIIQSALQAPNPQTRLAVILVITSVVSAGYYLYVVMVMFMRPRRADATVSPPAGAWTRVVVAGAAVLIIVLGVLPNSVVRWTERSKPTIAIPAATASARAAAPALP
jgi:NADH-quinone oxidoreductase subunit N